MTLYGFADHRTQTVGAVEATSKAKARKLINEKYGLDIPAVRIFRTETAKEMESMIRMVMRDLKQDGDLYKDEKPTLEQINLMNTIQRKLREEGSK